jgi:hypothetical protein
MTKPAWMYEWEQVEWVWAQMLDHYGIAHLCRTNLQVATPSIFRQCPNGYVWIDNGIFQVRIHPLLKSDWVVRVLVHELRHIVQHLNGWHTLGPFTGGPNDWHGQNVGALDYMERPWEIDAFSFEANEWELWEEWEIKSCEALYE